MKLKFAAMNLKKLAKRKWKERYPSYLICFELLISNYLRKNPSFAQAKLGFLDSLTSEKLNFSDVFDYDYANAI